MHSTAVVVDDSSTMRNALEVAFGWAGVLVVAAGVSGKDALLLYELHRPAFIILDIDLPELDGVAAAAGLLRKYPEAAVMVCCSPSSRDKIVACRESGVTHFLLKPFTMEKVAEAVAAILKRRQGASVAACKEEVRV
jgi:two-component system, chemotaxis family, chemotaxis protein CheY